MTRHLRCAGAALAALLLLLGQPAGAAVSALEEKTGHWLSVGYDNPDAALAAIDRALAAASTPAERRAWQRTRGLVAARAGRPAVVEAAVQALGDLHRSGDPLAAADADLLQAMREQQRGQMRAAGDSAQSAANSYTAHCGPRTTPRSDCDHFSEWLAWRILQRHAAGAGDRAAALAHIGAALGVARRAGDAQLLVRSLAEQAALQAEAGDGGAAQRSLLQAQAVALPAASQARAQGQAWLALGESRVLAARGDKRGAVAALERARRLALRAASPRLEALALANLSDAHARGGRPSQALAMVEAALPTVRRHNDQRAERVLLHNAALAHISLGDVPQARRQAERLFELWAQGGSPADQAGALREVADALAAAGDVRGALELFHRERKLVEQTLQAQRQAAERVLRERYQREAQQRSIELKARDNAAQAAELHNRTLMERLWAAAAALLGLSALLVGLLLRRVRDTQRALRHSQAQLRLHSERDPLTGLANRRHGQDALRAAEKAPGAGFGGALLLVDVDHFKHINDRYGHAVGDRVLVEAARRLQHAVRNEDLLVRWGGEEFLVVAPHVSGAALDELAARLLRSIGGAAIASATPAGALTVTVSIGYGAFPLVGAAGGALSWERALNLADMALYTAKSQGRNRAVGIAALEAAAPVDAATLNRVEADFERAWQDGLVRLTIQPGV